MRVDWTEFALDRVDEIALRIAADDRDAAVCWTVELFNVVDRLAAFPESGWFRSLRLRRFERSSMAHTGSSITSAPASRC